LEIGGWVPLGRIAEDGVVPAQYAGLREAPQSDPALRTSLNVQDSDATLIVSRGPLSGGSLFTLDAATRLGRPVLHVDLAQSSLPGAVSAVCGWLAAVRPRVLNVAGPRASEDREIRGLVFSLLQQVLSEVR
jgi:hypothetical protein